jgi:hypothetical protein
LSKGGWKATAVAAWFDKLTTRVKVRAGFRLYGSYGRYASA